MISGDDAREAIAAARDAAAAGRHDREAGWIPLLTFGGALLLGCPLAVHVERPWFSLPFWLLIGPAAYVLVGFWGRRRSEELGLKVFSGRRPQGCGVLVVFALGIAYPHPLAWGICGALLLMVIAASLRSGAVRLAALVMFLVGGAGAQLIASETGPGWELALLYGVLGGALAAWGAVSGRRTASR
ncbi:hypothetical protein LG634_32195 [Streptomyces bambusae]|uniref:hypothetical protein n=1 Tax=Streptomyces bambusae TaxID=1550616 RepID=UPI001CFFDB5A|nr:hypothetical protein [Streptomyces bambusae]MCB5169456.1 hypothetical protein [Streptomyces bambusae]